MFVISLIIIAAAVAADQITKYLICAKIALGEEISIIRLGSHKIFSFTNLRNTGAAWSSFSDKTSLLTAVTVLIIAALCLILYVSPVQKKIFGRKLNKLEYTCFSLVVAGGLGNIIDRVRLKYVVDFIKPDFIDFPVFNFADMCVVIGCIIFIIDVVISDAEEHKKKIRNGTDGNEK